MDVNLPGGYVLNDVPEGTTQKEIVQRLYDAKHPAFHAAMAEMHKQHGWGSGIAPAAYDLGGKVTDALAGKVSPEVAGGAGYAANVATQAAPALLSGYRMAGVPQSSVLQKPADWLMQSAIKPSQADRISGNATRAIHTMQQEGINATSGGMGKTSELASGLDDTVKNAVIGSNATVGVAPVGSRLRPVYDVAKNQVNPEADTEAVRKVWDAFRTSPAIQGKTDIPVQLAQALKSGTYKSLGGKSYGEVGSTATEAQKALARGLREEIAAKVPEVVEPLKREASLMNVKDVAMNSVLAQANKNPLSLAALRMDNPLSAATFMADKSALLKSLVSHLLYQGGKASNIAPVGVAAGQTLPQLKREREAEAMRRKLEDQ